MIPVALIVMAVVASSCLAAAALGVEILQPAGADSEPRADNRSAHEFITTWETTTVNENITIPGTGTYDVSWGDTTSDNDVLGSASHTYAEPGTYMVQITGDLVRINLGANSTNAQKLQSIGQWGDAGWANMYRAFKDASNMEYNAADAPDLSGVGSMSGMFRGASSFNGNLSGWDVSSVTVMTEMFRDASSFNGNVSGWDIPKVTDMRNMFSGASSFNQDLSNWDTSSVTRMFAMFNGASSFNGNVSGWDVSKVTGMRAHVLWRLLLQRERLGLGRLEGD